MSFLEQHDPVLFSRFSRVRKHDRQLREVFEDLETVASELERNGGRATSLVAGIVAELTDELRHRVTACELAQMENKENK